LSLLSQFRGSNRSGDKYSCRWTYYGQILAFVTWGLACWAQTPSRALPLLTRADQVRQLSPEEAARGYPVQIRGVVTDDVPAPDFFVQDESAGIYVEGSISPRFVHHFGDLVELRGVTGPGKFAPVIREREVRVLGKGSLPETRIYPFSELAGGQQDSQWLGVRGIVRSVSIDRASWRETVLVMTVASGGGRFTVRVPIAQEQDFSSWVDSEVLIDGVCGSLFNANRQLIGVLFYVPQLSLIKVEMQAKGVPFSSLMRFSPAEGSQHRVRVQGVVSYQQPGRALFLQDAGQGLRVLTQQDIKLVAGDIVDVVGFPAVGASAPVLEDAAVHLVGRGLPPKPVGLDLAAPWEQYDGALVASDADLLQVETQSDGQHLLLQHGALIFEALLEVQGALDRLPPSPVNSKLRITGICLVSNGGLWSVPQSFRILLRSAQDVQVLHAPPWWNLRRAFWGLGILGGILIFVLVGMLVLGRKLREQMVIVRQKLQHGGVLEERNRIARELHDTLEQELAGITMQLDLAVDCFRNAPPVAFRALDAARKMSRHGMVEARRSVWDLRCDLLEQGDLPSALGQIVRPLAPLNGVKIDVKVIGKPVRLVGKIEMNLLRIGQEAVANALKHGHASQVQIELQYTSDKVILRVSDDGGGFSAENSSSAGHFGMLDMRERAEAIGSHLEIDSASGCGTRIAVEVHSEGQSVPNDDVKAHSHSGRG
jgi:signal transduction histidine kinase